MEWLVLVLLAVITLIVNYDFKKISKELNEQITQYEIRFSDVEQRLAKLEGKTIAP